MMRTDVEVMDDHICRHCRLMEVDSHPITLFGDGHPVLTENRFACKNLHMCTYLRELFEKEGRKDEAGTETSDSADYFTTPGCGDRSCDR